MKSILRYDQSGNAHEEPATVDAVEAALLHLDNAKRTTIIVEVGELEDHQTVLTIHGHIAGPLVCCWMRQTAYDSEFQRWLLAPGVADGEINVRVWGADTPLPARFVVSAAAVRARIRSLLAGEDLGQHGPWEDTL